MHQPNKSHEHHVHKSSRRLSIPKKITGTARQRANETINQCIQYQKQKRFVRGVGRKTPTIG